MGKKIILGLLIMVHLACVATSVSRNPDYLYLAPTYPQDVTLYDGFWPNKPFIIIGVMVLDATWALTKGQVVKKATKEAAKIGGNAIVVTNTQVNVIALNRSMTAEGQARVQGNQVTWTQIVRDNTIYLPIVKIYFYIVKWL